MAIDFPNSPTVNQTFTSGSTTWVWDGTAWNLQTTTTASNDSMPVGSIMWFAGSTAPTGWILANGAVYPNGTYPNLYAAIGNTYGGTVGTSFAVPSVASTTGAYYIRFTTAVGVTSTLSLLSAPVGSMVQWPVTSSYPTGWIRCDGASYSTTTYNDLFTLIQYTYGGSGSSFNVPNISGAGAGSPVYIIKATTSGLIEPSTVAHGASHSTGGTDVIPFAPLINATGGTITTYTDVSGAVYKVHAFTTVGNTNFIVSTSGYAAILVVAGGGGGGYDVGGGGGAGGLIFRNSFALTPQTYVVTVGAGGAGATSGTISAANDGNNSVFSSLTAIGGGAGGSYPSANGRNGGSGGGGVGYTTTSSPGEGTYGQGFAGGASQRNAPATSTALTSSGGGGAAGPGAASAYWNGGYSSGGAGRYCDITGVDILYASGGRGAQDSWAGMTTALANSGNGGDGSGSTASGSAGASGIVIIKYRVS